MDALFFDVCPQKPKSHVSSRTRNITVLMGHSIVGIGGSSADSSRAVWILNLVLAERRLKGHTQTRSAEAHFPLPCEYGVRRHDAALARVFEPTSVHHMARLGGPKRTVACYRVLLACISVIALWRRAAKRDPLECLAVLVQKRRRVAALQKCTNLTLSTQSTTSGMQRTEFDTWYCHV